MTEILINTNIAEMAKDLGELRAKIPSMISDTIHEIGNSAYYYSQTNCPVRTGNLKLRSGCDNSIPARSTIFYNAPYAAAVEFGSGIYGPTGMPIIIRPKVKKALHWVGSDGMEHFAKSVSIRGCPPRAFVRGAVERVQGEVDKIAGAVFDRYVGGK